MKHIKMVLYGEPGVGKSVFASKAPKPFFITTDGNYEFLSEFGAKEEDHVQVNSWTEFKTIVSKLDLKNYETVVVDLTEDLFKWCEYEFCRANGYEHVSDPGFAKGYDITRNDFFINISKLLNLEDKNVILIMHGVTSSTKDRRGIEHTKYYPTNRIPDKVLDMIEGRVRYFLRCYTKAEEVNGKLIKKRFLSLIPKENEYGILRGIDENTIPSDIPLDFDTFAKTIGLETATTKLVKEKEKKIEKEGIPAVTDIKPVVASIKPAPKPVETPVDTKPEVKKVELKADTASKVEKDDAVKVEDEVKAVQKEDNTTLNVETAPVSKVETVEEKKARMLAEIKAKIQSMQNKK